MIVCVTDLKAGMVLASDVKGPNGRLLLPSGTELNEKHLRIFNIWGVTEATINAGIEAGEPEEELSAELVLMAAEHADAIFKNADMDVEPMSFFRGVCEKEYAKILSSGLTLPELPTSVKYDGQIDSSPRFKDVSEFLKSGIRLTSFPDVYDKIITAVEDPSSTSSSLADVISKDPGLCAKLLSLVNSPLYGFNQPIDSLSRAVSLVGTRGLSQLALSVTVMDLFKDVDAEGFSMSEFWKHSLACGVFCRILATQLSGVCPDRCFVVGMLHDLGRLVMLQQAPEESRMVFGVSREEALPLYLAEKQVFGFDHCELTKALFELWNVPDSLSIAVAGHHGSFQDSPVESAICSFGDAMAIAMQYGSNGSGFVYNPYAGAWEALGLAKSTLATSMLQAHRQIDDILTIFGV